MILLEDVARQLSQTVFLNLIYSSFEIRRGLHSEMYG